MLSPAFITCDKTLHLEPHLTFSFNGIKIEYLDLNSFEDEKMIALQWEISNIISISCKWAQNVSNSLLFYFIVLSLSLLFHTFHSSISMYHRHQVGSALITLLAGPKAETGNAGTRCAFPHITTLHDT